ncbi:MAG: hypothetical protein ABSE72_11000 [Bacteroidales bacterium]|jgi:hypothetical protein
MNVFILIEKGTQFSVPFFSPNNISFFVVKVLAHGHKPQDNSDNYQNRIPVYDRQWS